MPPYHHILYTLLDGNTVRIAAKMFLFFSPIYDEQNSSNSPGNRIAERDCLNCWRERYKYKYPE